MCVCGVMGNIMVMVICISMCVYMYIQKYKYIYLYTLSYLCVQHFLCIVKKYMCLFFVFFFFSSLKLSLVSPVQNLF